MTSNTNPQNRSKPPAAAMFDPDSYLALALQRIFMANGMEMYRVLKRPARRSRLAGMVRRMNVAWRQGERTGRWRAFARTVDRLRGVWLEAIRFNGNATSCQSKGAADAQV